VHHHFVRDIAVSKNDLVDAFILNQLHQVAFGIDRDPLRVTGTRQLRGIEPALDIWNLGGCKCHDFILRIVAEEDIEIMKIAPGGAHDEGTDGGHFWGCSPSGVPIGWGFRYLPDRADYITQKMGASWETKEGQDENLPFLG
jgi:hypothetical protein